MLRSLAVLLLFSAGSALLVAEERPAPLSPRGLFYKPNSVAGPPVLRYSLLLKQQESGTYSPVDIARPFREKDCVAYEVNLNRPGYLYVLQRGPDGKWDVLIPNRNEPAYLAAPNQAVRVPQAGCFEFDAKPGRELIYLIGSDREQSLDEQKSELEARAGLRGRDIRLEKAGRGDHPGERDHAMYATASEAGRPLIVELQLEHQ